MERIKKRRRKRLMRLFFLLGCSMVILFVITKLFFTHQPSQAVISATTCPTPTLLPTNTPIPNSSGLEQVVQEALQGTTGSYGIVIQNLETGEYYGLHQDQVFKSGSLYKLWVMAVVYQQIQEGKLNLSDTLSKDLSTLAKEFNVAIDPTEPQTSGTLKMTVQDALSQMITISDNNAALLLTDKVRISSLSQFLLKNGFNESKIGVKGADPTTTASDIALFFNKLYKGQLANPQQTTNMINLLKDQRLNEKIPLNLPDGTMIAHKTGEIDSYSHDAGIVYGPSGDYIIVILTQTDDTDAAIQRIANVSEAVYNYFNPTTQ